VDSTRKIALITGIFFVITFVTSIPALILYGPVLNDPNYVVGAGAADSQIFFAAFLEIILAISGIGTGVVLFPLLKWENEAAALGYVAARIVESAIIVLGVISLVSVVTLRHKFAGAGGSDASSLVTVGRSLVAVHNWTFLFGPGVAPSVNDLLLGYLLYRTALLPRPVGLLGMVGGPVLLASSTATLFGLYEQVSVWSAIATIPVFVFELMIGIWLIAKGFNSAPIIAEYHRQIGRHAPLSTARR